ncbi:MAG: hypothetical protein ACO3B3_05595 [Cyanobium sp.]
MLLTAALNPRPSLALRLLTWTSPALPIGAWIAAMAAGGAALSAGATALALRDAGTNPESLRRRVHRDGEPEWREEEGGASRPGWRQDPVERTRPEWAAPFAGDAFRAGPSRQPGQPPPTVAVPFRVIRAPNEQASARQSQATRSRERASDTVPQEQPAWDDDWGSDQLDAW